MLYSSGFPRCWFAERTKGIKAKRGRRRAGARRERILKRAGEKASTRTDRGKFGGNDREGLRERQGRICGARRNLRRAEKADGGPACGGDEGASACRAAVEERFFGGNAVFRAQIFGANSGAFSEPPFPRRERKISRLGGRKKLPSRSSFFRNYADSTL